ncbi:MAG: TIM barrel protein [archaeon]
MKIGVKTFDNPLFLKHFKEKVDFFEIQAIQTNDYSFLKNFSLPMMIHAENARWNVDLSDKSKKDFNLKAINFARKIADFSGSKKIIIHPGMKKGRLFSIDSTIEFLKEVNDKRILVENIIEGVGSFPEDIKEIIKETKVGFCFDVNHAIECARGSKLEVFEVIKDFLKLNPSHFHIGGQNGYKTHLSLKDFDYDWKEILSLYPKNSEITLETTIGAKEVEEDVKFIKKIIKKCEQ